MNLLISSVAHRRPVRRGNVVALVCVMMPVLLAVMAYCIHVAYVESVHSRIQVVTDVVARSAGRQYTRTGDRDQALVAALAAVDRNRIGDVKLPVTMADLEFGISDRSSESNHYTFSPLANNHTGEPGNSVRFSTRTLHDSPAEVVPALFPSFGLSTQIRPLLVAANTQGSLDISIVLDRSGSMRYASNEEAIATNPPADEPPGWVAGDPVSARSRWRETVYAVDQFIAYLNRSPRREKVCVSTYASESTTDLRLTLNTNLVAPALDEISNSFQGGGTAIGLGMAEGLAALTDETLARSWAVRVMVLMTDGIHNVGVSPESVADQMLNSGVMLFTVTFGDSADQDRMRNIAEKCGGEHFHAVNGIQLNQVFQDIGRRLPSLLTQ